MSLLYGAAEGLVTGTDTASVTQGEVDATPAPSLGVRLGDGPERLAVLVSDAPHLRLWAAGKAFALQTDGGRILRSSGFSANLSGVSGENGAAASLRDERANAAQTKAARQRTLFYDFADLDAYSVRTVCALSEDGRQTIHILGKPITTRHITERCRADLLGWSFTNSYWVGETGFVWKSVQNIHPRLAPLTLEVLRPPTTNPPVMK